MTPNTKSTTRESPGRFAPTAGSASPAPTAAGLAFDKYEGLGNDFIVIEAAAPDVLAVEQVVALCDRRFGVGADGVIFVLPPPCSGVEARMRVVNADGSVPEMCGNGVRCVALHVARTRGPHGPTLRIATDAGVRECAIAPSVAPGVATVTVDMGIVRVVGERTLDVAGQSLTITLADAGNPHAILFGEFAGDRLRAIGSSLAVHTSFPKGTNVEFARIGADGIDVVVWERGVGLTLACGTGACATVAVACAKGLASVGAPIVVRLPGGALEVTIDVEGRATMRGPARHVYSGTLAPGILAPGALAPGTLAETGSPETRSMSARD